MSEKLNEQTAPEIVVINIEDATTKEIAKFNITDALIQEVKDQYSGLKVNDINDKNQISTLKKAVTHLQKLRTGLEKKRKELVAPYNEVVSSINGEAKRILEELQPIEKELKLEEARVKEEIEKAEKEAERLLEERKKKRVDDLILAGAEFDGSFYSSGNVSVDINTIANITDDEFTLLIARTESETKRVKEERTSLRLEKIFSIGFSDMGDCYSLENKIDVEHGFIESSSDTDFNNWFGNIAKRILEIEQEKRKQEEAERVKKEIEAKKSILNMRCEMLKFIGFTESGEGLKYVESGEVIFHSFQNLQLLTDAEFMPFIQEQKDLIEKIKKEKEEIARKLEVFNSRKTDLFNLGFSYNQNEKIFEILSPFGSIQIEGKRIAENSDDAYNELLSTCKERISDIKEKEEEAKKEAEAKAKKEEKKRKAQEEKERVSKLSDIEKVEEFTKSIIDGINAFDVSILNNANIRSQVDNYKTIIIKLTEELNNIK